MVDKSQRRKGGGRLIPTLNMAIDALNIAKEASSTTPVNPVFSSVVALLTMIRVSFFLFRYAVYRAHVVRTRWPMNKTTLTLDCPALTSVKRSNGGWMESR